ncbi:MAG: hypothetical protein ACREPD_21905 [Stenotrophomonas sp.]|uniref:hypothetical protein n=1 Tax=Gammaproteobacteria TaxID=1236 RepID=UPI003D6D4A7C
MSSRAKLTIIRTQSCYPVFRGFIGFAAFVGYIAAALILLAALLAGNSVDRGSGIGALAVGVIASFVMVLLTIALKEASLMLADIADCAIWEASPMTNSDSPIETESPDSHSEDSRWEETLGGLMRKDSRGDTNRP